MQIQNAELVRSLVKRRMVEIQEEMAGLNTLLGQLTPRNGKSPAARHLQQERDNGAEFEPPKKRRGRKPMTAAQRKAVSLRMRKMWAAKRKAAK